MGLDETGHNKTKILDQCKFYEKFDSKQSKNISMCLSPYNA